MYAKVFSSIFDGSMRGHSDLILVFVNLLCAANQDGIVDRHWQAISDETGLPVEKVKVALEALEGPDIDSRSRNDDGRRLKRLNPERSWGWEIINFKHYRQMRTAEERREYLREYMREWRREHPVNKCKQSKPIAYAYAEANADNKNRTTTTTFVKPTPQEVSEYAKSIGFNLDADHFCSYYEANGWKVGRNPMKSWQAAVRTWRNNRTTPDKTQPSVFALKQRIEILTGQREKLRNSFDFTNNREAKLQFGQLTKDIEETNQRILEATA